MADVDEVLDDTTSRMEKSVTALERELGASGLDEHRPDWSKAS